MPECHECGTDPHREAHERAIHNDRLLHYRRALLLACGGDREKVKAFMRQAEPKN